MRRSGLLVGVTLLVCLPLLAACSGEAAGPSGSDPFDGTVRIGATFSETGKFSVEGKDTRQGYDTWLTWVNETYGGIRIGDQRYRAEIVYYDDESDADTAVRLTQRLIDDDGSTSCWAPTRAASPPAPAPSPRPTTC